MPRKAVQENVDFLAGTKLAHDPHTFEQAVREAFLFDHDATKGQEIAEIIGWTPGRLSQVFADPRKLQGRTVREILDCIRSHHHRKNIVRSWSRACFGDEFDERRPVTRTGSKITQKTVYRIDRFVREHRFGAALETVSEALIKVRDADLYDQLLDRAQFVRLRLNQPGHAMLYASLMVRSGRKRSSPRRQAAGHVLRARIISSLVGANAENVEGELRKAEALIHGQAQEETRLWIICDDELIETVRENARLTLMERGSLPIDEEWLQSLLAKKRAGAKPSQTQWARFKKLLTVARINVLLGHSTAALDFMDKAFASGEMGNVHAPEMCGLLYCRVSEEAHGRSAARRNYRRLSANCWKTLDLQHQYLCEQEMARLYISQNPGSWPDQS